MSDMREIDIRTAAGLLRQYALILEERRPAVNRHQVEHVRAIADRIVRKPAIATAVGSETEVK